MKRMSLVLGLASLVLAGCVERELTINTVPTGAVVTLNDEEIGQSPVSTNFQWYGDYNVRVSKAGYETLVTHRNLKSPIYDYFPFDFFATIWPGKIKSKYQWSFELEPYKAPSRKELLDAAEELKNRAIVDANTIPAN
jgi:hypothetical protein